MILFTKKFNGLSSLFSIIFLHLFWSLFFGNPQQEAHIIIAYILLYFTKYYLIDEITAFSRIIQQETEYWEKKFMTFLDRYFEE
jgi:hypothetical protein